MSGEKITSEITGKKIFFLYPPAPVQNQIITELAQHEYEVYIAKAHNGLMQTLKKYPDSVIFINIDEQLSEAEWEKWITGLITAFPDIKIGVFSASTSEELKTKYVNKLHASLGFMPLKLDMSKAAEKILEIMKILHAKGRRKYLRASCEREETPASINMPLDGDFINGFIRDISVVGVSCVFENAPELAKNSLHKDIQIRLQSILVKVEAVVLGSRDIGDQKIYVMLFTPRTDPEVKVKIRKYIQHNLQAKMDHEIR